MLSTLAVAALLSLNDPPGDASGSGSLAAPTATLLRGREAFDITGVSVPEQPTFGLSVSLESISNTPPLALLEFYLSDANLPPGTGTAALLPGSGMRLPEGQRWLYAVRFIGETVQVFGGRSGEPINITETAAASVRANGAILELQTNLPLPQHFSLYGMAGSFDPFSQAGWRELREAPSPWGFAGPQAYPVLDVVADSLELQQRALAQGVLPEIRGSSSEQGWLLVAGAGVALAVGGMAARIMLGRRQPSPAEADTPSLSSAPILSTPLSPFDAERRLAALAALKRGDAQLIATEKVLEPEPVMSLSV